MNVQLSETDLELLETLAVQVAWYMVCGEFHEAYGGPEALATRLKELEHAELILIRDPLAPGAPVTAEQLAEDARVNDCYEDLEDTREPRWDLMATDAGFKQIESRLARQ